MKFPCGARMLMLQCNGQMTWAVRHLMKTTNNLIPFTRGCVTQCESEESSPDPDVNSKPKKKNQQAPLTARVLKPVSLMGTGDPYSAVRRRRQFLKDLEKPKEEDDYVPSVLKIMYQNNPELVSRDYPVVAQRLEYISAMSKAREVQPKEQGPLQYPFKTKTRQIIRPTSNAMYMEEPGMETVQALTTSFNNLLKYVEEAPTNVAEVSSEESLEDIRLDLWKMNYGTCDPKTPSSSIPCGGCGAFLHCRDSAIPGFLPSERFKGLNQKALAREICQRCTFLQHFNVALNVTVSAEEYPRIMSEIKNKIALVVLMVDLTDFPCSIWPGIINVIGSKRPLVVVGNKVDLLPQDDHGFLKRVKASLRQSLMECGVDLGSNVRYIGLVSAKTGYGVEDLITELQNLYKLKGDVYIVGCTNVGKSTLFNALLQSDFCKVQAVDIVQRATTSVWPGTTLNLLKFPIMRPTGWRLYLRMQRLRREREQKKEEKLKESKIEEGLRPVSLIERIGMTFREGEDEEERPFSQKTEKVKSFLPNDPNFRNSHFCYDTPGAVYKNQILELLTIDELIKTLPKETIIPRTFILRLMQTLFLAGLGRVDLLEGPTYIKVTVFASAHLPVHIIYTEVADVFYRENLGTPILGVPSGGPERLKEFPALEGPTVQITGMWEEQSVADILLSSAGWIAVTLATNMHCKLKLYTPEGRGCHVRQPSLLPFAVKLRGDRIKGTPAYDICN